MGLSMMPGNDDKFSDQEDVKDNDENDGGDNHASRDPLSCWSQTLSSIAIPPFVLPVGPKVAVAISHLPANVHSRFPR